MFGFLPLFNFSCDNKKVSRLAGLFVALVKIHPLMSNLIWDGPKKDMKGISCRLVLGGIWFYCYIRIGDLLAYYYRLLNRKIKVLKLKYARVYYLDWMDCNKLFIRIPVIKFFRIPFLSFYFFLYVAFTHFWLVWYVFISQLFQIL